MEWWLAFRISSSLLQLFRSLRSLEVRFISWPMCTLVPASIQILGGRDVFKSAISAIAGATVQLFLWKTITLKGSSSGTSTRGQVYIQLFRPGGIRERMNKFAINELSHRQLFYLALRLKTVRPGPEDFIKWTSSYGKLKRAV